MCPIGATGDEDGTVQVEYEITEGSPIFSVRTQRPDTDFAPLVIDRSFDLYTLANDLLADLGA